MKLLNLQNMFYVVNHFYYFYSMQTKPIEEREQIIVKALNRDKLFVRISPEGIFELKDQTKNHKKLFPAKNLYLRILKSEPSEGKFKFMIRLNEDNVNIDFVIDDKRKLEILLRLAGQHSTVVGLQQCIISFRKVGEGAFAQVYEAITNFHSKFALKSFEKKSFKQIERSQEAFQNEIAIIKMLRCPYIVPFQYVFESDKAFYLKMEFFDKSLKDKISGKLLVSQQKEYMRQLLTALVEMKKKNIIHRDLKPDNVMIRKKKNGQQECVIIDFGLATIANAKDYIFVRCGTPGFLAPEIANATDRKQKQTCAADTFSLGCIFYKMLTGHYLFPGQNAKEVLHKNRKCIYSKNVYEGLSSNQIRLLNKMLEPSPARRIKPEQALKQPYFMTDIDDDDQIPEQECSLSKNIQKISQPIEIKNMDSIRSSCESINQLNQSNTSAVYKRMRNQSIKDSCLTLEFGHLNRESSEELLRTTTKSNKLSHSKTPEKSMRHSRFSRIGKQILI